MQFHPSNISLHAFHAFEVMKLHWLSCGRILPWCISLRANFKALVKCWNVNWAKRGRFQSLLWGTCCGTAKNLKEIIIQLFFRHVVCTTCMIHDKMICDICMFWSSFVDVYVSNIFKLFHQSHNIYSIYIYIRTYICIYVHRYHRYHQFSSSLPTDYGPGPWKWFKRILEPWPLIQRHLANIAVQGGKIPVENYLQISKMLKGYGATWGF